jgi:retron-type reverse transcriptase
MDGITTGHNNPGLRLIPPFPISDLFEVIRSELASSEEELVLAESLQAKMLPPLINGRVLSFILGISHRLLYAMANVPARYYRHFQIEKRSGGTRLISTPRVFLKVVQRWILLNILYRMGLPSFVTGFVPERGLLANGVPHVGRKYLARVDLQDFFPSISFSSVQRVYADFGFTEDVSRLLTKLSTLNGSLPQGAPTSPYLANLVFLPCDDQLKDMCEKYNFRYSRYADDLTFSSNTPISGSFLKEVESVVSAHSFRVNGNKVTVRGPGQRLVTTGMVVNAKVHPPRDLLRRLRARFHQATLNPNLFVPEANRLLGWAAYVNMYDRALGAKYLAVARNVQKHAG